MNDPLVRVRDLEVRYPTSAHGRRGPSTFAAISGIDLDVGANEIVGVVGESGSGKSTLGRAIAGLQAPAAGSVTIGERDVWSLSTREMRAFRQDVQFVFQDPYSSLNPRWSVAEAIERPLRLHSDLGPAERKRRVAELLQDVGLTAQAAARFPSEMSGGQRQRVAIARALLADAPLLLLDDALSAVDTETESRILAHLRQARVGRTVIIASHRLSAVADADHTVVLREGRIAERGTHAALAQAGGWYARQWRYQQLQASLDAS